MSSSTKTSSPDGAAPDLNKVIAAAGHQIFSYLPLGSLINGLRSPILTNTIFYDSIFQSLGQTNTLCLSAAPHLRKISDDQLITFIRNIVEVSEAYHPGYNHRVNRRRHHDCSARRHTLCPAPIKVSHLDLSRCRNLLGEGVHYCIKHMPSVERILLSNMSRFMHNGDHFHTGGDLSTRKLQYLDVSQCAHLNTLGIKRIITTIQGKNIKHLDFSGCSDMIDDSVAGTVAFCRSLESLNLEGSKKITSFGVGLISYVTRHTLRCLSLRHCEDVHLPKLVMALADELIDLAGSDDDHRALPPNFAGDDNDRSLYIAALCSVLVQMMRVHRDVTQILAMSNRYQASFEKLDSKWETIWGIEEGRSSGGRMFGNLEVLDLGFVGHEETRLEGCLATIAWLNGGKLKQVDLEGLNSVSHFDISVLGSTSCNNLKRLDCSAMADVPSDNSSCFFFHSMKNIRELDLSNCKHWGINSKGVALVFLTNLRSLKVDHTDIRDSVLVTVLTKCKHLLRLSAVGCKEFSSTRLCAAKLVNRDLNLLELDIRHTKLDSPLWKIQRMYRSLLRLNGRLTEKGSRMLKAHQFNYAWRVGAREVKCSKSKKRKRDGTTAGKSIVPSDGGKISFANCCSILSTGLSYSKGCEQEMYGCKTCGIDFGNFVCMACTKHCHEGHEVFSVGYGTGCCDCCIFSDCKCLD